jgi:hypothetical protein
LIKLSVPRKELTAAEENYYAAINVQGISQTVFNSQSIVRAHSGNNRSLGRSPVTLKTPAQANWLPWVLAISIKKMPGQPNSFRFSTSKSVKAEIGRKAAGSGK